MSVQPCSLPENSLLSRYRRDSAHADCYTTDIARCATHAEHVFAFYTSPVFKLERLVLKYAVARPSTDLQARQLADGSRDSFAAWDVEDRRENQLLLCDLYARTRSWLMTEQLPDGKGTRLYFGSAVMFVRDKHKGTNGLGGGYRALMGFHRLYSRILLRAAASRLISQAA